MRVLLLLALLCVAVASPTLRVGQMIDEDADLRRVINSADVGWTAGVNPALSGVTYGDLLSRIGTLPPAELHEFPIATYDREGDDAPLHVPDEFNGYKKWGKCAHPIRNQGHCGSCWAFGASEVLSDRFCLQHGVDVVLSPQDLVSCDTTDFGCQGGMVTSAWTYMMNTGVVSDTCMPYTSGGGSAYSCPSACTGSGDWVKYHAASVVRVPQDVTAIQSEVMMNGPVEVTFIVYEDFAHYVSGVYRHISGHQMGYHAVKLMGWGTSPAGDPYWLLANSWSTSWGEEGQFRILRGTNECNIEANVITGMAGVAT